MSTVFVGMSGGVDSSLTAALIKEQGLEVVGVYMKNWAQDLPGFECPWKEDYRDAKRVAVQLGIDFTMFDFQEEYHQKVVDYMIEGYKAGLTPNPDVMCNQEIKFKLFLDTALENGADYIATGHYSRTKDGQLLKGVDESKDQSYFLYRVQEEALRRTLFPLGGMKKSEVRKQAAKRKLITADKKDSQGICFVGKVGIREFLEQFVDQEPGPIVDQHGKEVGEHDGAIFYTIGQRHGLGVGGGLPYYVTGKNMETNTVFVTTELSDDNLWSDSFPLHSIHWINEEPAHDKTYDVRTRYRGRLIEATLSQKEQWRVHLTRAERAISPGQSAVVYEGDRVVGGGIIS